MWQKRFHPNVRTKVSARKHSISQIKRITRTRFLCLQFFIWIFGFQSICLLTATIEHPSSQYTCLWWNYPLAKVETIWRADFFFGIYTHSWRTLASFGHSCVPMHTNFFNILCFSCQGKSRDIVYITAHAYFRGLNITFTQGTFWRTSIHCLNSAGVPTHALITEFIT